MRGAVAQPTDVLLRRAELRVGVIADVQIGAGRVTAVGARLDAQPGVPTVDLDGRALLPGLVDHHIHLMALAAADESVDCGPAAVRSRSDLGRVLREARRARPDGWLRGRGLDVDLVGPVDRITLDGAGIGPVRVQDRTGAVWHVDSIGLSELLASATGPPPPGMELDGGGSPTGRLFRLDSWLGARLRAGQMAPLMDLSRVGRQLAGRGVTAVTDATATNGPEELRLLAAAVADGSMPFRVTAMTGQPDIAVPPQLGTGPVKLVLDDDALPALDNLTASIRAAHDADRAIALHCVTVAQLVLALGALEDAGRRIGDRVEHASLVPESLLAAIAMSGVTVVTQPGLLRSRGDRFRQQVDAAEHGDLYRIATLRTAGVPVAGSTDAPFGPADPWLAIAAAVDRLTETGACIGRRETVSAASAIALFHGTPDVPGTPVRIEAGRRADLCVLASNWQAALDDPERVTLEATLVDGVITHGSLPAPH